MTGIYKITSPTNKVYIGQSWSIYKRWSSHKSEKSEDTPLYRSFRKHGVNNHIFSIAHELPKDCGHETMDIYEDFYITAYKDAGINLLNIKGGGGSAKHSEETKRKIGDANKGNKRPDLTAFNSTRKGVKGRKHSEETRIKIAESNKGRVSPMKGKKQNPVHLQNRSNAIKEWWRKRKLAG